MYLNEMTNDAKSTFLLFTEQIDQALAVLEQGEEPSNTILLNEMLSNQEEVLDAGSLLARCEQIAKRYEPSQRIVRSIHHFACTGGSLISKCINALPGVCVISEVHPLARRHLERKKQTFTPTDLIVQSYFAGVPDVNELSLEMFKEGIRTIANHAEKKGFYPIFREHSHTDYCVGDDPLALNLFSKMQQPDVEHKRVVTVRNPIDSFASLVDNGWVHHNPGSFDEYCRRYLLFLSNFEEREIFRYEDFVADPDREMTKIAAALSVPHNELFGDIFDFRLISGDSGRKASRIGARPARDGIDVIRSEANSSKFYGRFTEKYGLKYST